jgi:hypothetical protein
MGKQKSKKKRRGKLQKNLVFIRTHAENLSNYVSILISLFFNCHEFEMERKNKKEKKKEKPMGQIMEKCKC